MFIRTERSIQEFMYRYPIVSTLIIIHLVIWLFTNVLPFAFGDRLLVWGIGQNYAISAFNEYRRLFTPIFFHADLMHALMNSFSLVIFGPALERMLGKYKFIIGYLFAGIIGNVGTYLIEPTSLTFHLGASGAVYGLFGFYMFMVFFRKDLIDQNNAQIVMVIFIIGLILTFVTAGINKSAHIFGFIGGLAAAPVLLRNARPFTLLPVQRKRKNHEFGFDPNRWQKKRFRRKFNPKILWTILVILIVLGIFGRFL